MFHLPTQTAAVAVVCSVALLPLVAQADGVDYSYIESGYVETDVDDVGANLDGFSLRGSFEFTDAWFVFADYTDQSYQGLDVQDYRVGVGYAWPVASATNLYGKLSYVKAEAAFEGFSVDNDGYGVAFGIRSLFDDRFELEASVDYTDMLYAGNDVTLGVAARWYFVKQLALGVEIAAGEDTTFLGLNLRWSFGN